jgi:hypothetical protein
MDGFIRSYLLLPMEVGLSKLFWSILYIERVYGRGWDLGREAASFQNGKEHVPGSNQM